MKISISATTTTTIEREREKFLVIRAKRSSNNAALAVLIAAAD